MAETHTLSRLYAYNTWANARVFSVCLNLDSARLEAAAPGTIGTVDDTLRHMVGVEHVYSLMLQDKPLDAEGAREEHETRDLSWVAAHAEDLGTRYAALVNSADDAIFTAPLHVPWFDFALTKHDGLLQVLSHSAQHRAQVFSVLGANGIVVPSLDYVDFVEESQAKG